MIDENHDHFTLAPSGDAYRRKIIFGPEVARGSVLPTLSLSNLIRRKRVKLEFDP